MEKMIAYCGLICSECSGFLATQAGDREALDRLAAQARDEFSLPDVTVQHVMCDGCLATTSRQCGYCAQCEVRACAAALSMPTCAACADYGCEKLQRFFGMAPSARATLEALRAGLAA